MVVEPDDDSVDASGSPTGTNATVELAGRSRPPESNERGWKDTVVACPGEVTRVRMRFENDGQYVWHCHIVEHEDNEMMRPFRVGPGQPGQPAEQPHQHQP